MHIHIHQYLFITLFRTIERINDTLYEFLIIYKVVVIYFPYSNLRFDSIWFIHFILCLFCTDEMYDVRKWKKKKNRKEMKKNQNFERKFVPISQCRRRYDLQSLHHWFRRVVTTTNILNDGLHCRQILGHIVQEHFCHSNNHGPISYL